MSRGIGNAGTTKLEAGYLAGSRLHTGSGPYRGGCVSERPAFLHLHQALPVRGRVSVRLCHGHQALRVRLSGIEPGGGPRASSGRADWLAGWVSGRLDGTAAVS